MDLICNRHGISEHRLYKTKNKWKCKKCEYLYSRRYMENLKLKAIAYKGDCCSKCGYKKCWQSLRFHHIDPSKKEFAIFESRPGYKKVRSWVKLKQEIDKCILLCANCHFELHSKDEKKSLEEDYDLQLDRVTIEQYNKSIIKKIKTAKNCFDEIIKNKTGKKENLKWEIS